MDKKTLADIQALVKAPKGQFNKFGNYKYRKAEDILEAVKPIINPLGYWLTLTDSIIEVGGRIYVEAVATLTNGEEVYQTRAFAREEESKKGMDASQVTGASSSYARKYALNGLFSIDDTQDADATNTHEEVDEVGKENRDYLLKLLDSSTYDETLRYKLTMKIAYIKDLKGFEDAKINLLANQLEGTESINPSAKDINNKIKKTLTA
jgi:hypothetical protein